MEKKKIKKLALKKETISNLSDYEQKNSLGGRDSESGYSPAMPNCCGTTSQADCTWTVLTCLINTSAIIVMC